MKKWLVGLAALALVVCIAHLSPVDAWTQQSPYDYGDANMDGDVTLTDLARARAMVLCTAAENSAGDANTDGGVSLTDLARTRAIVLGTVEAGERWVAWYDFSSGAGTEHLARYKQVTVMPAGTFANESGWSNFSSVNYSEVEAIDTADFSMEANATAANAVQCRFTVDEWWCAINITHIELNVTASSQNASETLEYWVWNFETQAWDQLGQDMAMGNGEGSYYRVSDCGPPGVANYIDESGHVYALILLSDDNRALDIDYIEMVLVDPGYCGSI